MRNKIIAAVSFALAALLTLSGCAEKMPPNTVSSEEDMEGRDIGYVVGTPATVYADGYGTMHAYKSAETMLVDLKNGVIDCAVMEESAAKSSIKKVPGLKTLREPLVRDDFHFAVAKENPDLTEAVNAALKNLLDSGIIDKIIKGYESADGFRYKTPDGVDLSAGTLTIAVIDDFPPYSYDDGGGNTVGIDVDIARAVCDILHVQMEISLIEKSDLAVTVQYGKADLALGGVTNNEDDAELVDFTDPYTKSTQLIVVRR